MAFIDHDARELNLKIVYCGPGLAGKTTILRHIHHAMPPERRSAMTSRASEVERMLFFSLASPSLPPLRGLAVRLHLYTVPGAAAHGTSHELVLTNVDGVVFVADSQRPRAAANVDALEDLEIDLAARGRDLRELPLVMQYNKRDLPQLLSVAELDVLLGAAECPRLEAVATNGVGVLATLEALAEAILAPLRDDAGGPASAS